MGKFPEAENRLLNGKFVCKQCKTTIRTTNMKVLQGRVACRDCKSRALRPKRKK